MQAADYGSFISSGLGIIFSGFISSGLGIIYQDLHVSVENQGYLSGSISRRLGIIYHSLLV
jgi:hypothetical protein